MVQVSSLTQELPYALDMVNKEKKKKKKERNKEKKTGITNCVTFLTSTEGVRAQVKVLPLDGKESASPLYQNKKTKHQKVYRSDGGKLKVRHFQINDFYLFVMSKEALSKEFSCGTVG